MARPLTITNNGVSRDPTTKKVDLASLDFVETDNDNLKIASTTDLELGTGDFSIEFWTYLDDLTPTNQRFFNLTNGTQTIELIYDYSVFSERRVYFTLNNLPPNQSVGYRSNTDITTATWIHLCVERENGIITLYFNGVAKDTADNTLDSNTLGADLSGAYSLTIGSQNDDTNYFDGKIDNFRISNIARYGANFTPREDRYLDDLYTLLLIEDDSATPGVFLTDRVELVEIENIETSTDLFCSADSWPNLIILDDYTWDQTPTWDGFNRDAWIQGYKFPTITSGITVSAEVGNPVEGAANLSAFAAILTAAESQAPVTADITLDNFFQTDFSAGIIQTADARLDLFGFQLTSGDATAAVTGQAQLEFVSIITATASADRPGQSSLSIVSNLNASADVTASITGQVNIEAEFAISTDAVSNLPVLGTTTIDAVSDIRAVPSLTVDAKSSINVFNNIEIVAGFSRVGELLLSTEFSLSCDARVDIDAEASLTISTELVPLGGLLVQVDEPYVYTWDTVPEDTWQNFVADKWDPRGFIIFNNINLQADAIKGINGECVLENQFALSCVGSYLQQGQSNLEVTTDILAISINFKFANANLITSTELTAEAKVEANANAVLPANFDVIADSQVTASVTADCRLELFAFKVSSSDVTAAVTGSSEMSASFDITAQSSVEVDGRCVLDAFVTKLSDGQSQAPVIAAAELLVSFDQTVIGTRLLSATTTLVADTELTTQAEIEINASANLTAFAFVLADGQEFGPVTAQAAIFDDLELSVDGRVDISASAVLNAFGFQVSDGESVASIVGDADLSSEFFIDTQALVFASVIGDVRLPISFDIETIGDLRLLPSRYIAYVNKETRNYITKSETRTQPVIQENRLLDLQDYET